MFPLGKGWPNVPTLRFQPFANSWNKTTYGEISSCFSGGTPQSRNPDYYGGSIPFIRSGEIHGSTTDLFLSENGLKNSAAKLVNIGDVLLALYGATSGQIARSQINGAINQAILCIRPSIDPDFLIYSWQAHAELFLKTYLQGGQGNLSAEIYKSLPVYVPSKAEQVKVSSLCRAIDQRISVQNKIIKGLESLEKDIIHRLIWGQEYGKAMLGELLSERTEKTSEQNQFVILSSTATGLFAQEEYFNHQVASENNVGYKIVRKGDVILSPQNLWLGNINYNDRFECGMVSPSYKVFSIKDCYAPFLSLFLKTKRMKYLYGLCSEQGASVVRRNLNVEEFLQIAIPMPPMEIQRAVAKRILTIKQKRRNESKYRDLLLLQKKYLLENMFI